MKSFATLSLIIALLACAHGREFTSADGSKTLNGEFVRYDRKGDQVTLRLANGRNLVTGAGFFSEKDRLYFIEEGKKQAMDGAVSVDVDKKSDHISQDYGQMRVRRKKVAYSFQIENASDYPLKDLEIKHWVVVERNSGGSKNEILKGGSQLSSLPAGGKEVIAGPEVLLTVGAKSTCDCPKVAEAAAKIGRDDIVGERIEVRNSEGKLIHAESSSRKVDQALGLD